MSNTPSSHGYSASVAMTLVVAGREYPLSHVGPTHVRLREPAPIPTGEAELIVSIDGDEDRSIIRLLPAPSNDPQAIPFREVPAVRSAG